MLPNAPVAWHDQPIVVINVETTGLNPREDLIIELAVVRFDGSVATSSFSSFVDPGIEIPEVAFPVLRRPPAEYRTMRPFHEVLAEARTHGLFRSALPCSYNASFARSFILAATVGANLAEPAFDPLMPWLDPVFLSFGCDPTRSAKASNSRLRSICEVWDIEVGDSLEDRTRAAGTLLLRCVERLRGLSLHELIERQREFEKAREAAQLARWKQRRRKR